MSHHLIREQAFVSDQREIHDNSEVYMESPEVEPSHHRHTGRPWLDVLLGVSAVSISFISLFLAIANGRAMERLVQSNSWPFIQIDSSDVEPDSTPHIRLFIVNKGRY